VNLDAPLRHEACDVDLIPSPFFHRDRTVSEASPARDELAFTRMIQSIRRSDVTFESWVYFTACLRPYSFGVHDWKGIRLCVWMGGIRGMWQALAYTGRGGNAFVKR
jgi:hypothetical protein